MGSGPEWERVSGPGLESDGGAGAGVGVGVGVGAGEMTFVCAVAVVVGAVGLLPQATMESSSATNSKALSTIVYARCTSPRTSALRVPSAAQPWKLWLCLDFRG